MEDNKLIFKDECYDIIGACIEVYKELGFGFSKAVYQEAMEIEMELQGIPYEPQVPLEIFNKNKKLQKKFVPDFICFDEIIVEIKAVDNINDEHVGQVLNYLKATGFKLGIIVNFGQKSLVWKRIVK